MPGSDIMHLPKVRSILVKTVALSFLQACLITGQAAGLSIAIVGVWEGNALELQIGWISLFFICLVLRQVISSGESKLSEQYAKEVASSLRIQLLESTFHLGPSGVKDHGSAAMIANLLEGIDSVQDYITLTIPKTVNVIVTPFVLLVVMFWLDWVSGIIALVCYPFIVLFMRLIGMSAKAEASRKYAEFEQMSNTFTDTTNCIGTLKAFGVSDSFSKRILESSEKFRSMTMKTLSIAMLSSTVLDVFATLALAAVAIMLGFRLVDGSIAFLPSLMILMMVPDYFKPIREFGEDYHSTLDGRTAMNAIEQICNAEPHSHDFLDEVQIDVKSGSKVGVFGASGAGKSTLLDVLSGFTENENVQLFVDGQLVDLCSPDWRERVAYIPQSSYIFNASLRENVAFYNPRATDEEIVAALRTVGLESLIKSPNDNLDTNLNSNLNEGNLDANLDVSLAVDSLDANLNLNLDASSLDVKLGIDGMQLSGGQLQRIALARILLDRKRDVWVFDEPTAHLDIETEYELKEKMLPLMDGKLIFFGTHSMHWQENMDSSLFLKEGRIDRMRNPHEEEIRGCGTTPDCISCNTCNPREEEVHKRNTAPDCVSHDTHEPHKGACK